MSKDTTTTAAADSAKAADNGGATAKSLESWIWAAACSIRGAKDAPKFKEFILPLVFTKRLCDVFDDELDRMAQKVGSRAKAFALVKHDKKLVRFHLPLEPEDPTQPVWSVIRTLSDQIGERLTTHLREIADANPLLKGIVDRVDFNATTHGQRDIDDNRLSNLIEAISAKRLGLADVEPDIIGRSYEYLIRKFAEGSGQSAGEFYTPAEVGMVMARVIAPEPGMDIYDPCCGSAGLLVKCELASNDHIEDPAGPPEGDSPLRLYGQELEPGTWAMANMNMIIHDMEGDIQIGDTFRKPAFRDSGGLRRFDRVVANPMWNQPGYGEDFYEGDSLDRFPFGYPTQKSADWAWLQHITSSLNEEGRAAVVLDAAAVSRGSDDRGENREKRIRERFLEADLIEAVILLPDNLFYNTTAQGIIVVINRSKQPERKAQVLLIDASDQVGHEKPKNFLTDEGAARIVEAYQEWRSEEGFSRVIDSADYQAKDFNLNPARYVERTVERIAVDLADAQEQLEVLREQSTTLDTLAKELLASLKETGHTGTIPEGWRTVPFGDVAKFVLGRTPARKRPDYFSKSEGHPWVTITDMAGRAVVKETKELISPEAFYDVFKERIVKPGTLLMTIKLTVGRTAFMGVEGVHNEAIVSITPDEEQALPKFLYYFLPLINYREHQDRAVKGQTINLGKLRKLDLVLPPKPEQERIIAALDVLEELVEVEGRIRDMRVEVKNELIRRALAGELEAAGGN